MASEINNCLLTIVIPVYNRQDIVNRTLISVASQTARPLNVILVDNNSTDNTLATLSQWKSLVESDDFQITILTETQTGAAAARNCGLHNVTTPYVMFFDSDDEMLPQHLQRTIDAIDSHPDADIIGWDVEIINIDGTSQRHSFSDKDIAFRHIFNCSLATQRYAVKSSFIRKVGQWNPAVMGWNDYELGVRLILNRPKVHYIKGKPTVLIHRQADSITGTNYSSTPDKWENALECCLNDSLKYNNKRIYRWLNLKKAVLAGLYRRENNRHGLRLLQELNNTEKSPIRRAIYQFASWYVANGFRGIHYIVRPFI